MSIEEELSKLSGVKQKGKEDRQKYLSRLVKGVEKAVDEDVTEDADANWEKLSEEAQGWYNKALKADQQGKEIADFAQDEEEDEEEESSEEESEEEDTDEADEEEGKADEESEEAEDEETETNEEEEGDMPATEESKKSKKSAPPKKASGKKEKPAKKQAKNGHDNKAKSSEGRGRKSKFGPDMKITVLAKENPRRQGTAKYEMFKLYKTGMTVAEAKKKGITSGNIATDVKRGNIKVS